MTYSRSKISRTESAYFFYVSRFFKRTNRQRLQQKITLVYLWNMEKICSYFRQSCFTFLELSLTPFSRIYLLPFSFPAWKGDIWENVCHRLSIRDQQMSAIMTSYLISSNLLSQGLESLSTFYTFHHWSAQSIPMTRLNTLLCCVFFYTKQFLIANPSTFFFIV